MILGAQSGYCYYIFTKCALQSNMGTICMHPFLYCAVKKWCVQDSKPLFCHMGPVILLKRATFCFVRLSVATDESAMDDSYRCSCMPIWVNHTCEGSRYSTRIQ